MALVVNTNVSSLNAQRQLAGTTNGLSTAMERLSSGQRINSAADDAAGLAISTRMTSQVRGLTQAVRNANDGISIVQTAEGALQEVTDMLQRMRELAVQSSSGSSSDSDLASSNDEISQLLSEIDRVASTTRFNNMTILDGSYSVDVQIGDQTDQSLAIGISNMSTSAMGETVSGLGEAATGATVTSAGTSNAADYAGRSITIADSSSSTTVSLSTNPSTDATAAAVSGTISGEDYGPATSRVLGTIAYQSNTLDLTTDTDRVFGIRVKDGGFVDIDFTNQLITQLGYASEAELEDVTGTPRGYANEVSKEDFLAAAQAALDEQLTGDYAVTISVGYEGEIKFTDVDGREDTISLRAGAANAVAGTFIANYVHADITTNATMTNVMGQGFSTDTITADFQSTDNFSVFKASVNGATAVTVDFLDKLNDTNIVKDRAQILTYEYVNAIQAELDEMFTGDSAVTVGIDANKGVFTFSVAGGDRTITLTEGNYLDSNGDSTASTFVATLVDSSGTVAIDNKETGLSMETAAVNLGDITTEFKYDHYGINVRVNGGASTDIDLSFYLQDVVADHTDVAGEEVVAALQAAFNDNFSGDDAVTVSLDSNGRLNFDVAGGAQVMQIREADFDNDGTFGTFGATFIESTISGATTAFEINENLLGEVMYGNVEYGDFDAVSADSGTARSAMTTTLNGFEGDSSDWGDGAKTGSRLRPFAVDDLNSVLSSTTAQTTTTAGLTVAAANDAVGISIDDATAITVTVDQGEYSSLEAYATALQYEIDAHGSFNGDNALNVNVEYYTNATSATTAKDGQVARLVLSNDYGKKIEISGEVTVTTTNGYAFFGAETDTVIADTKLFDELGIDPAKADYRTHDRVDGGIDTTVDGGIVTLAVDMGGNTYSYGLALDQDENTSFDDFVSDLQTKANAAFAAHGISFTGSQSGGEISFAMDTAGDATMSLSGSIVQSVFGADVSGSGLNAGNASMADVVSAINADLASAGVAVTSAYDEASGTWTFSSNDSGAASAVSVSGSDLAQLGMTAGSANGTDATATAAVLSSISVTSASDALSAIDSIDNALEYISSQRSELGAVENRLNHTINNLSNVIENTAASRSRILDADYAVEAANLAKLQVMQQAGSAMLAQANAQAQVVLSLLG